MAAPSCPLLTAEPCSAAEAAGLDVPELRAYKLGLRRWSYNSVEVKLREAGGGATGRSAAVVHAAANGVRFAAAHQDSAVGFLLQLDNGAKVQAHVFLCYADATPASRGAAGGGGEEDEQFAWSLVTRAHCCKGCQGAALRSIQRFGRVGPRQAKRAATEQPADTGAAADSTAPVGPSGRKQPARKDPRFMYLSLDEACTHVGVRAFRLVAGIYNRQGTRLLGTTVSPPIRVLANNDAPTGAARIVLEATLPSDWEGWSGGNGSGLGTKRSAAAAQAQRKAKRPSGEHAVALQAALSMPGPAVALPLPHMPGHPSSSPGVAAAQQWQQVQGPLSPDPQPIARQPSLPSHPPSPLVLGGGSSCPPSHLLSPLVLGDGSMSAVPRAYAAPAGELWAAVPPAALAAQLAPSLPFYSCSQVAAQHEAERQLTLLQQLKASMAGVGSASASSCGIPHGAMAGWCSGDGSTAQAEAEQPPRWLPGTPLTGSILAPTLPTSHSLASADTSLSAACAAALTRVGSVAGSGSPGGSLPLLPPPSPPTLEPGLGLGGKFSLECSSLEDDLDLEALHSLMGDLDDCGLSLDMGCIFDDSDGALQFDL